MLTTAEIKDVLTEAKTIAVVGCSPRPSRTSHRSAAYLQRVGYRVIPVNPYCGDAREMLGERCYPDLLSIPQSEHIDIVNIFRQPRFTADMVRDALARIETTAEQPVIWTQIGVSSPEAQRLTEAANLPYIANRCILVEHSRLL